MLRDNCTEKAEKNKTERPLKIIQSELLDSNVTCTTMSHYCKRRCLKRGEKAVRQISI